MKQKFRDFLFGSHLLFRSVSPILLSLFILAVFAMNLLANKSLNIPFDWLALDCGIVVSWVAFLCMDVLTKHYGPRAATLVSLFAIGVNLLACLLLWLSSLIPGVWGAYYDFGELGVVNDALDATIGGTWYVVLGSTTAFIASAVVNNFSNWGIGKLFRKNPNGFLAYACRTYLSTAVGQFADNLIFAFLVSHFFFGWSVVQCLTCAATGMVAELLCEAVFSPIGYRLSESWRKRSVGKEYLDFIASKTHVTKNEGTL